jgi:ABC-type glycerol-3-phosphate transport system substrate-binding protein
VLVLYSPTNAIGVGTLVAISRSLGLDYHKPADMTKTFNWIRDNLNPLILQWISDEGVQDMLMQKEDGWVTISNPSFARLYIVNGMDIAQVFPTSGLQDRNGMALIAKDTEHLTLAKLWLNYVLSQEWQLQQYPDVEKGTLYGALESVVVHDYWKNMSDEGKAIETNPSQLTNAFYELDWAYLASQNEAWIQQFQDIVAK